MVRLLNVFSLADALDILKVPALPVPVIVILEVVEPVIVPAPLNEPETVKF